MKEIFSFLIFDLLYPFVLPYSTIFFIVEVPSIIPVIFSKISFSEFMLILLLLLLIISSLFLLSFKDSFSFSTILFSEVPIIIPSINY